MTVFQFKVEAQRGQVSTLPRRQSLTLSHGLIVGTLCCSYVSGWGSPRCPLERTSASPHSVTCGGPKPSSKLQQVLRTLAFLRSLPVLSFLLLTTASHVRSLCSSLSREPHSSVFMKALVNFMNSRSCLSAVSVVAAGGKRVSGM